MQAMVLSISRMTLHNGPGIRTVIFLKGCPLRCVWCSTPESQKKEAEIAVFPKACIGCGKCVSICPHNAVRLTSDDIILDRTLCDCCGLCTRSCHSDAIRILGSLWTVEDVIKEVKEDQVFFKHSGGGATISGGEPLIYPEYVEELAMGLKKEGINVGIDTSGYVPWSNIETVVPYVDFFLWDMKHMDPVAHKKITGVSNELIIQNLISLSKKAKPIYIRVPVIPGYNDDEKNIRQLCVLLANLDSVTEVNLLPVHHLGKQRYYSLNRDYPIENVPFISQESLDHLQKIIRSYGLKCSVVG